MTEAFIYEALRTPRGRAKDSGGLHDLTPLDLLAALYRALEQYAGLDPALLGDIVLGCVTQHGEQAGNIARASSLYAGWPDHIPGLTVNRYCASGLDAVDIAAGKVVRGQAELVLGGGVEMMSRVPMLSDDAKVFTDPELAARAHILLMGSGADLIATLHGVTREEADAVALVSQRRAARARDEGRFSSIVAVENPVQGRVIDRDECIRENATADKLAGLEPAFAALGASGADARQLAGYPHLEAIRHIHTAGNSPAMADAAAVVLVGSEVAGNRLGAAPRARIVGTVYACDDPLLVVSGAVAATRELLHRQQLTVDEVDLFQIHEAFAATVVMCRSELGIPDEKLNVNGGVIALGHPMGATGAIMLGMLMEELEQRDLRRGVVAASGAAGSGSAMLIQR